MKYELKEFNDFLKIPADRLEKCLSEFTQVVLFASAAHELAKAAGDAKGVEFKGLVWNDDGKEDLNLKIEVRHDS